MQTIDKRRKLIANALWLGLTLMVFFCLVKLAFWQYQRGFEKEQRTARIVQLNQQSPLTLNEVVKLATEKQFTGKESINDFPVTITGVFNEHFLFLLDNQVEKYSLGYRVLQVVETPSHAVLVNLGWVQGSIDRSVLPNVAALQGQYKFKGHVRIVERGIMLTEQDFSQVSWPLRVQQIELTKFSALISPLISKPLLPFVIYVDPEESLGYKKNWHPMVMPAAKHFGYTFQWATLAIAWLILMVCLRIKTQKPAPNHSSAHSSKSAETLTSTPANSIHTNIVKPISNNVAENSQKNNKNNKAVNHG